VGDSAGMYVLVYVCMCISMHAYICMRMRNIGEGGCMVLMVLYVCMCMADSSVMFIMWCIKKKTTSRKMATILDVLRYLVTS
jgi:hypothetical protein